MNNKAAMIEELSKRVYDAKAAARKLVTEVMKEKKAHSFSESITLGYYNIGDDSVYFETAEWSDPDDQVVFNCKTIYGEKITIDMDEFDNDDITFFDIAYDIMEV